MNKDISKEDFLDLKKLAINLAESSAIISKNMISQSEISISSGEWSTVQQIGLSNKTDTFLYQVWLKFIINSKIIKPDNIEISLGQNFDDSKLNIGNIELNQQMYKVHASDSKNEETLYLVMEKLEPKTNYQIGLTIKLEINAKTGDSLTLYISSFSAQPSTKNKKKDKTAVSYSFVPPENMTLHSVSLITRYLTNNGSDTFS